VGVKILALLLLGTVFATSPALAGGGPPRPTFVGTEEADTLLGTGGPDRIRGLGGEDELYAGAGNDEVYGGAGEDHVYGGGGDDVLWGSNRGHLDDLADLRRERLVGGAGRDVLASAMGGAVLQGGRGDDQLHAGRRSRCRIHLGARRRLSDAPRCVIWLLGGPGRDRLFARNAAADVVVCGRGDVLEGADRIDRVYPGCVRG
jgi:hypothetical protein